MTKPALSDGAAPYVADPARSTPPGELFRLFLRLGCTAFGGPAAHIALMKDAVLRRGWMTEAEFLDLLGATNLIPGPNSTELAIHIGFLRGRWLGMMIAGACFILPAALMVGVFAWAYVQFGSLPAVSSVLYAVKPVVLAVVAQAIWGLIRPAVKNRFLAGLGLTALVAAFLSADELLLLFGAGAVAAIVRWADDARKAKQAGVAASDANRLRGLHPLVIMLLVAGAMVTLPSLLTHYLPAAVAVPKGAVAAQANAVGFGALFLFFLKVGAVLYGSGYVLLAFLRDGLVTRLHYLTQSQLLDAVAVGQVTPGPVFTTATFVGYVIGGPMGAVAATLGIFLPSFVFVAVSGPLIPRLRAFPLTGAFLDGVNVAALALMAAVTWELGRAALRDWFTVGLALLSALLLIRYKVNSAWLILGAAALGIGASLLRLI